MIQTTYTLRATSNKATVYSKRSIDSTWTKVAHFECPECKLHDKDLVTDKPGRIVHPTSKKTISYSKHQSAKQRAIEMFAKSLCEFLDKARKKNQFSELVILSSHKFQGLLYSKISKQTLRLVRKKMSKKLLKDKGFTDLKA